MTIKTLERIEALENERRALWNHFLRTGQHTGIEIDRINRAINYINAMMVLSANASRRVL